MPADAPVITTTSESFIEIPPLRKALTSIHQGWLSFSSSELLNFFFFHSAVARKAGLLLSKGANGEILLSSEFYKSGKGNIWGLFCIWDLKKMYFLS
jgi:hypothetical protein